jgi:hypothetical protein
MRWSEWSTLVTDLVGVFPKKLGCNRSLDELRMLQAFDAANTDVELQPHLKV